LAVKEQINQPF